MIDASHVDPERTSGYHIRVENPFLKPEVLRVRRMSEKKGGKKGKKAGADEDGNVKRSFHASENEDGLKGGEQQMLDEVSAQVYEAKTRYLTEKLAR